MTSRAAVWDAHERNDRLPGLHKLKTILDALIVEAGRQDVGQGRCQRAPGVLRSIRSRSSGLSSLACSGHPWFALFLLCGDFPARPVRGK